MKTFDVDAKHLIRTYIDSIEEYARQHTRMHPNEIDGLLNEINDFVYLRSGELTTGERVQYDDVLKAIEECGSPSEICEDYLQQEEGQRPKFLPKTLDSEAKNGEQQASIQQKLAIPDSSKARKEATGIINFIRRLDLFDFYRFFFLLFIGWLMITLITYNPFQEKAYYIEGWQLVVNTEIIDDFALNACSLITLWASLLIFWEGVLINRWKTNLIAAGRMERNIDDSIVLFISRFAFLLVSLKTSLLFVPVWLLFLPIWMFLACLVERQLKSQLWIEKLGPWLTSVGLELSSQSESSLAKNKITARDRINELTKQEKALVLVLVVTFGVTFVFPWLGLDSVHYYNQQYFIVSGLQYLATFIILLSLIVMVITLGVMRYYKAKKTPSQHPETFSGESEIIMWLMRLIAFKALLLSVFLTNLFMIYFGIVAIIIVLVASELVSSTYGGRSVKSWIGKVLVILGSSNSFQKNDSSFPQDSATLQTFEPTIVSPPSSRPPGVITSLPVSSQQVLMTPSETSMRTEMMSFERKPSLIYRFFKGTGEFLFSFMKAIIMTIMVLLISAYEVILTFIVILTNFSTDGSFEVPVVTIDNYTRVQGIILFQWHALILLGLQIFVIVLVQWYSYIRKKPEGVVLKLCKNLTRVLFVVMIIGFLTLSYYDNYFYVLIGLILIVYSELTAWKIRSERRTWISHVPEQKRVSQDSKGKSTGRTEISSS